MKNSILKSVFLLLTAFCAAFATTPTQAQTNYVSWDFTTSISSAAYSTNTTNQNAARSSALTNVTLSTISINGSGVSGTAGNTLHRTTGWPTANAIDIAKYQQYSVTLTAGDTFPNSTATLAISAGTSNVTSGPLSYQIQYGWGASPTFATATNGIVTGLTVASSSNTATIPAPGNTTTTVLTIRLLAYNSGTGTGNIQIYTSALTGSPVLSTNPSISVSPSTLTGFTYVFAGGPSSSQFSNVTGSNLTPASGNLTVSGSTNYEVSSDNTTFGPSATIPYLAGTLASTPFYVRLKAGLGVGNYNAEIIAVSGGGATTKNVTASGSVTGATPPTLTPAPGATVDAPFQVTFPADPTWRTSITGITVGGTTLAGDAYDTTVSGQITFTPSTMSASALLQTSGTKTIVISSTGYNNATVSQILGAGVATKLAITTQPTAPVNNGGNLAIQPVVAIRDQYSNLTTSTANVTATADIGAGTWTLGGGTNPLPAISGTATFTNLNATSAGAVTGATITFTSGSLTLVTSSLFNIPAPVIDYVTMPMAGTPLTQNFDSMATTVNLPLGWRMAASTGTPLWNSASNVVTEQASSGTPATGGTYNWGSSTSERAVGAMTSGTFDSPNNLIVKVRNSTGSTLTSLSVNYSAERYRINTAAASVSFFYSLNGTTWIAITAGDIPTLSFPTGNSAYNFANGTTVSLVGITKAGLSIASGSDFYLRWNLDTTGSSSQGIGIDNVSVTGTSGVAVVSPTVTTGAASAITQSTATLGGNITATGGANATVQGVEVSLTPSFANGTGTPFTNSGSFGTGAYTVSATGLQSNKTYYYHAYATNSAGTSYGTEASFATPAKTLTFSSITSGPTYDIGTNMTSVTVQLIGAPGQNYFIQYSTDLVTWTTDSNATATGGGTFSYPLTLPGNVTKLFFRTAR